MSVTHYMPGDPIYGERGVLDDDGETVECHICGKRFAFLGLHVKKTHEMEANEYRKEFGLKQRTGLTSSALKEKHRDTSHLRAFDEAAAERLRSFSFEERSEWARNRDLREEQLRSETHKKHTEKFTRAGQEAVARARAEGTYVEPGWPDHAGERGRAKLAQMLQDPEFKQQWSAKISEARGGISTEMRTCPICGEQFEEKTWGKRRICSEECHTEHLRRQYAKVQPSKQPQARAKISEFARHKSPERERDDKGRFA